MASKPPVPPGRGEDGDEFTPSLLSFLEGRKHFDRDARAALDEHYASIRQTNKQQQPQPYGDKTQAGTSTRPAIPAAPVVTGAPSTVVSQSSRVSSRLRNHGLSSVLAPSTALASRLSALTTGARERVERAMYSTESQWRHVDAQQVSDAIGRGPGRTAEQTQQIHSRHQAPATAVHGDGQQSTEFDDEVERVLAEQRKHLIAAVDCDYRLRELFWANTSRQAGQKDPTGTKE